MSPIRVLVVDDHPIVRQGISSLLSNYSEFLLVGEADNGRDALRLLQERTPDVTVLDIRMPGESGLDVLQQMLQLQPEARVLMLTSFDDREYIISALQAGARGFILKNVSDDMLVSALRAVHRGERVLSPQVTEQVVQFLADDKGAPTAGDIVLDDDERRIVNLLVQGTTNADIARALYISQTTVKRKLRRIFVRLGVQTRAEAAAEAVRRGLV